LSQLQHAVGICALLNHKADCPYFLVRRTRPAGGVLPRAAPRRTSHQDEALASCSLASNQLTSSIPAGIALLTKLVTL
ncbi:unnamed protein product, partial [Closterium sp. Naga37s-1]